MSGECTRTKVWCALPECYNLLVWDILPVCKIVVVCVWVKFSKFIGMWYLSKRFYFHDLCYVIHLWVMFTLCEWCYMYELCFQNMTGVTRMGCLCVLMVLPAWNMFHVWTVTCVTHVTFVNCITCVSCTTCDRCITRANSQAKSYLYLSVDVILSPSFIHMVMPWGKAVTVHSRIVSFPFSCPILRLGR